MPKKKQKRVVVDVQRLESIVRDAAEVAECVRDILAEKGLAPEEPELALVPDLDAPYTIEELLSHSLSATVRDECLRRDPATTNITSERFKEVREDLARQLGTFLAGTWIKNALDPNKAKGELLRAHHVLYLHLAQDDVGEKRRRNRFKQAADALYTLLWQAEW